jgi:ABC-2 type transport system permease protein
MIVRLVTIEWLKARHRLAFWIAIAVYASLLTLGLGLEHRAHLTSGVGGIPMPASWAGILAQAARAGSLLMVMALVLLVASERSWRTQRQNIIDGLSRDQYVAGKVLLGLLMAAAFWTIAVALGTVFGWLDARVGGAGWTTFAEPLHYQLMGGLLLRLALVAMIAVFFGLVAGSTGGGLAFAVLFMIAQPPLMLLMLARGGAWAAAVPYLPAQVVDSLTRAVTRDSVALAALLERSVLPLLGAGEAALVASAYMAFFIGSGWLVTRYRDL